jgi:nicotinamidase-related amidase
MSGSRVCTFRRCHGTPQSLFGPGQIGAEFQPALALLPIEHVVEKNVPVALINSGLERWLTVRGIDSGVIVGVSTNNCVEATARTVGNLGFSTYVAAEARCALTGRRRTATPTATEPRRPAREDRYGQPRQTDCPCDGCQ